MNKEIKLYGTIGRDNITAFGVINEIDKAVSSGAKSITFRMHSDGGSVLDGNAIFNAIQNSKMHVKIIIDGIAASMASIVILAADEVEICENAFIMVHRPTGVDDGDADAHFQTSKLLKDIENNFIQLYSKKSGLTPGEVKTKWLDGKDHWLNADEAVKYGFAVRKVPAAFGAIPNETDAFCSFAFQNGEVMKADGTVKMYKTVDDPKERATIVGFEKRFIALPLRNKGIGAIVSSIV